MISKSLGHSRKFAAVRVEAGKLGEFAQLLYPLLVANADALGRQAGDPFTIKHAVLPTSPRRECDFVRALRAMHTVGLIRWYEVDDAQVIEIVGFTNHQDLHKEAKKSIFPEFSGNARNVREKSPLIELNSTQFNSLVGADAPAEELIDPDLDTGAVTSVSVGRFLKRFCELYSEHRNGAKYFVAKKRDVPNVRQLLRTYDDARLEKLAVVLLTTDDEWITGTDRGIGILSVKASWLDGLLADFEAKHGKIRVAS
jgi:hypothetical protein